MSRAFFSLTPRAVVDDVVDHPLRDAEAGGDLGTAEAGCRERANLPGLLHRKFCSRRSSAVHGPCHRFEMVWIHARADSAQVVQIETVWNRAIFSYPRMTMSRRPVIRAGEDPVAIDPRPAPDPARSRIATIFFMPPFIKRRGSRATEFASMPTEETKRFAGFDSVTRVPARQRRWVSAPAFAQSLFHHEAAQPTTRYPCLGGILGT